MMKSKLKHIFLGVAAELALAGLGGYGYHSYSQSAEDWRAAVRLENAFPSATAKKLAVGETISVRTAVHTDAENSVGPIKRGNRCYLSTDGSITIKGFSANGMIGLVSFTEAYVDRNDHCVTGTLAIVPTSQLVAMKEQDRAFAAEQESVLALARGYFSPAEDAEVADGVVGSKAVLDREFDFLEVKNPSAFNLASMHCTLQKNGQKELLSIAGDGNSGLARYTASPDANAESCPTGAIVSVSSLKP